MNANPPKADVLLCKDLPDMLLEVAGKQQEVRAKNTFTPRVSLGTFSTCCVQGSV